MLRLILRTELLWQYLSILIAKDLPSQHNEMVLTARSALLVKLNYYVFSVMCEYTLDQGA